MVLTNRQAKLLRALVREYTIKAEPVGSGTLADYFDVSPATIRNELSELELAGFLTHPHTSAGRIPTEAGYRYYIRHFLRDESVRKPETSAFRDLRASRSNVGEFVKEIAKLLALETGETAMAGYGSREIFYTGLTNLFSKPEFQDNSRVVHLSEVFDRMDEIIESIFDSAPRKIQIFLGRDNPFGTDTGMILVKIRLAPRVQGLIGLVGPMRMDYERNLAIMRQMQLIVENM